MAWQVRLSTRAHKNLKKMPKGINEIFQILLKEMELSGPVRNGWPNYRKLSRNKNCYHCHLQKGNPTYVAVWKSFKEKKTIEVIYVGTHEGVNYNRIC
jgi:mRNA-degrading endonuclease RelE of RelBE toxin-antitoxin system